jgi:demethylmenaquinone methyltransferase/2-methoxy-6-polyprenyl-1,4-benzoquinol methylase
MRGVGALYGRMATWYDLLTGPWEARIRKLGVQRLGLKAGSRVLAVGSGTGEEILHLSAAVDQGGMVCGVDISEDMLRYSRRKLWKTGRSARSWVMRADAARLPFRRAVFDAVLMSFVLELFDDSEIPEVLCSCRDVMRKGARICVISVSKEGRRGIAMRAYEWAHRHFPRYVDCRPISAGQSLVAAGFRVVGIADLSMSGVKVQVLLATKERG